MQKLAGSTISIPKLRILLWSTSAGLSAFVYQEVADLQFGMTSICYIFSTFRYRYTYTVG